MKHCLHINEPCRIDWESMTPVEGGRFCEQCHKTVIDLSACTEAEALERIRGRACIRVRADSQGRPIFAAVALTTSIALAACDGSSAPGGTSGAAAPARALAATARAPATMMLGDVAGPMPIVAAADVPAAVGVMVMLRGTLEAGSPARLLGVVVDAGQATTSGMVSAWGIVVREGDVGAPTYRLVMPGSDQTARVNAGFDQPG